MNPNRRRKKRPSYGVRTIEIVRGRNGFGFTISGQAPCILSCIVNGSPAERAGLRPGDYLIAVNGQNVSKAPHDDVVRMIGSCQGLLKLQIAENYYSNSSDDDIAPTARPRPKYPHRFRQRQQSHGPAGNSHHQLPYNGTVAFRNQCAATQQSKFIQTADHHDYKNISDVHLQQTWKGFHDDGEVQKPKNYFHPAPYKYSELCNTTASANRVRLGQLRVGDKKSVLQPGAKMLAEPDWVIAANSEKENLPLFSENVVNSIVYPSLQQLHCSTETDEPIFRAVVGYLGTIEMPKEPQLPGHRLSAIRNCIRRLRVEKKVHTLVLLKVFEDRVTLMNSHGATMAEYPTERITFCGAYTDDKKFFGLVTTRAEVAEVAHEETVLNSSSCHVFMVDPKLLQHEEHIKRAKSFRIDCVPDMGSGRGECCEFPESVDPILLAIIGLYRGRGGLQMDMDANVSPQPSNTSSNSDSGIGFRDEGQQSDRVSIVDLDNDYGYLVSLPLRHDPEPPLTWKTAPSNPVCRGPVTRNERDPSFSQDDSGFSGGRLTVRAMPDPVGFHKAETSFNTEMLNHQQDPSNIRKCVHKYMQRNQGHCYNHASMLQKPVMLHVIGNSAISLREVPTRPDSPDAVSDKLSPKVYITPSKGATERTESAGVQECTDRVDELENLNVESACDREGSQDVHPPTQEEDTDASSTEHDTDLQRGDGRRSLRSGSFRKHKFHFGRSKKQEEPPCSDGEVIGSKVSVGTNNIGGGDNCNDVGLRRHSTMIQAGRVGSWAVSFEKLLADPAGIHTFAEFLKKEFSYENISFWVSCERYRRVADESKLKFLAKEIYQKHLAAGSLEPINVDGHVRQVVEDKLDSPGSDLFQLAQKQIYDLMKFDCYSRFLKSNLYQDCALKDVAGEPLPYSGDDSLNPDPPIICNNDTDKNKENEDRRRKSLLPWHRTKSGKPKKGKGAMKRGERRDDGPSSLSDLNGSRSSVASSDIPAVQRQHSAPDGVVSIGGEQQDPASLCRVHFPDQSSTVVSAKSGETISTCMTRVICRRGLNYSAYDLYQIGTNKVMDLEKECTMLVGKEFRVEERTLYHVELPSKKTVAVKAAPSLPVVEALRPLLQKYGYQLDNIIIHVVGVDAKVDLNQPSFMIDKCQLLIQPKNKESGLQLRGGNKQAPNDTNSKVPGKLHQHNGSLDVQDGSQYSFKEVLTYPKLNGCPGKPPIGSRPPQYQRKDCEDMFDLWKKAQRNRLDDQRGTEINFELPEFLKTQPNDKVGVCYPHGRVSEPAPLSRQRADAPGKLSRLNSEVFPPGLAHRAVCDDNLLDDGILPTHTQAEDYFSACCLGLGEYRSSPGPRSLQNFGEFLMPSKKVDSWRPPLLRPSSHPITTAAPHWCRKHSNGTGVPHESDTTKKDGTTDGVTVDLNKSFSPSSVPPPADTSVTSIHGDMADYLPPSPLRPSLDKLTTSHVPLDLPSDPPPLPPKPRPLYRPVPLDLPHMTSVAVCNNSDEDKCALMRQSYSTETSHTRHLLSDNSDPYHKDRFSVSFV